MRVNLSHVNAHLVRELYNAGADIRYNGGDIVLLDLPSGETVAIHLVERDIDVGLIKDILTNNGKNDIYTLFVLWGDMLLPEDGQLYAPYDWMSTLFTLYGDKIYAWEGYGSQIVIYPVYFEPQNTGYERLVRYGPSVDMASLAFASVHTDGQHINGLWKIAHFDGYPAPGSHTGERQGFPSQRHPLQRYYDILGVAFDADWETVKKAYHLLAREHHPDVNKTPEATARMQQINKAYDQISRQFNAD